MTLITFPVPGIAQLIQASMLSFIYLDILQTDKWLTPLIFPEIQFVADDEVESQAINSQFYQNGFQQMMLLQNLGSTFVYMIIVISGFLMMILTRINLGLDIRPIYRLSRWLEVRLMWNYSLRFLMQQYPPLIISSLINMYEFKFDTPGKMLSSSLSVVIIGLSQLITLALLYKVNYSDFRSAEFVSKYGTLLEGINLKSVIGRNWSVLVMIRWTVTSVIMVLFREYYYLQAQTLLVISVVFLMLINLGEPFQVRIDNYMSSFNEAMVSAYLYTLMMLMLTDQNQPEELRDQLGNVLIAIISLSSIINVAKFFIMLTKAIRQLLKLKRQAREKKEREEKAKQQKLLREQKKQYSVDGTCVEEIEGDQDNPTFLARIKQLYDNRSQQTVQNTTVNGSQQRLYDPQIYNEIQRLAKGPQFPPKVFQTHHEQSQAKFMRIQSQNDQLLAQLECNMRNREFLDQFSAY
ncbi:hypothetical protein FGO68_gene897 [Halteria grandinella]|uniref:TRP C-terminal domain-containing protein n=1 Tax=Halteria grandinella TaxID=5974 RepID=A0A8J8P4J7_HALGN|nr:hypothetical protein FGO68_gene897 [Halteria grandinella]